MLIQWFVQKLFRFKNMTYSNNAKASKRNISKTVDEIKDSMMKEK